jgi:signal recognition particle subunit SRP72
MAPKPSIQAAKSSSLATKTKGKDAARKTGPKPPLGAPERLKRLFTSLCAQIDGGHSSNAIKTCDKSMFHFHLNSSIHFPPVLRLEPKDTDAIQTKLFLLLQTDQYHPALSLIEHEGENQERAFERSYSFYRLQREEEARQILTTIKDENGEDDRGVTHLQAQLVRISSLLLD